MSHGRRRWRRCERRAELPVDGERVAAAAVQSALQSGGRLYSDRGNYGCKTTRQHACNSWPRWKYNGGSLEYSSDPPRSLTVTRRTESIGASERPRPEERMRIQTDKDRGNYILVTCGEISGELYTDKFHKGLGSKVFEKCIKYKEMKSTKVQTLGRNIGTFGLDWKHQLACIMY